VAIAGGEHKEIVQKNLTQDGRLYATGPETLGGFSEGTCMVLNAG